MIDFSSVKISKHHQLVFGKHPYTEYYSNIILVPKTKNYKFNFSIQRPLVNRKITDKLLKIPTTSDHTAWFKRTFYPQPPMCTYRDDYPYEYNSWYAMKKRCNNPNDPGYINYGGRGITVCEEWNKPYPEGFVNFLTDMKERPESKEKYSIERIDNYGNYELTNCIWADASTQSLNRRTHEQVIKDRKYPVSKTPLI